MTLERPRRRPNKRLTRLAVGAIPEDVGPERAIVPKLLSKPAKKRPDRVGARLTAQTCVLQVVVVVEELAGLTITNKALLVAEARKATRPTVPARLGIARTLATKIARPDARLTEVSTVAGPRTPGAQTPLLPSRPT